MKSSFVLILALLAFGCGSTIERFDDDTDTDGTDAPVDTVVEGDVVSDTTPSDTFDPDVPPDIVSDTIPTDTSDPDVYPDVPFDTLPDPTDVPLDPATDDVTVVDVTVDDVTTPEICDNDHDDDGDGRTDCMDSDCLTDIACVGTCYPVSTISCGGSVSGTTTSAYATDRNDSYSCAEWDGWPGPEIGYSFTLTGRQGVVIDATGFTDDLDLFLLDGGGGECDADECLTRSIAVDTDPEHIDTILDPGTYHVVLDGYGEVTSSYNLSVTCASPEICNNSSDDDGDTLADCADSDCDSFPACVDACSPVATLSCGAVVTGTTAAAGATDVVETYSCTTWPETGSEYTYTFFSSSTSDVTFTIDNLSSHFLDLFVIGAAGSDVTCNPMSCIDSSTTDETSDSITVHTSGGGTYFIVVDGYADTSGSYRMSVTCS